MYLLQFYKHSHLSLLQITRLKISLVNKIIDNIILKL